MGWNIAKVAGCMIMLSAAPPVAQDFDSTLGVEAVAVLENGRILVRTGEIAFDCALAANAGTVELDDCVARPPLNGDAVALLSALSEQDWQNAVA